LGRLSLPAPDVKRDLEAREFAFLGSDAVSHRTANLTTAAEFIEAVPTLALAIRTHVRGMSLLNADEAYDVTHSEPRWPDWIFVSCPATKNEVSALRVAENVVHEAMHLQLTRVERRGALVADDEALLPSPWKQELRQLQGILHGLYVFRCIAEFLKQIRPNGAKGVEYIRGRQRQIAGEIASLPLTQLKRGLTPKGIQFLECLVDA
jgi:HEXXH motif-containing protein